VNTKIQLTNLPVSAFSEHFKHNNTFVEKEKTTRMNGATATGVGEVMR